MDRVIQPSWAVSLGLTATGHWCPEAVGGRVVSRQRDQGDVISFRNEFFQSLPAPFRFRAGERRRGEARAGLSPARRDAA